MSYRRAAPSVNDGWQGRVLLSTSWIFRARRGPNSPGAGELFRLRDGREIAFDKRFGFDHFQVARYDECRVVGRVKGAVNRELFDGGFVDEIQPAEWGPIPQRGSSKTREESSSRDDRKAGYRRSGAALLSQRERRVSTAGFVDS